MDYSGVKTKTELHIIRSYLWKKLPKLKYIDKLLLFLFAIQKFRIFFSGLKIALARSFFKILTCPFYANIPILIVKKDSEIKFCCYRGSGGHFF